MNELTIYTDRCLTCGESNRVATVNFVSKAKGVTVLMRRIDVLPEFREKALSFGEPLPLREMNEQTLDFFSVGKGLIQDKALEDFIERAKK